MSVTSSTELVSPEETQMCQHGILAPIAEVHIKGMISVSPDSCIFPYTEKQYIP